MENPENNQNNNEKKTCNFCVEFTKVFAEEAIKKINKKKDDLLSVLDSFLESQGLNRGDCIIGGSLALWQQGFPVEGINDIDIEMNKTDELCGVLSTLQSANPTNPEHEHYPQGEGDCIRYDFIFKGVKFNVWLVPNIEVRQYMYMNYFKFGSVMSILKYKFSYARSKDWKYYLNLDGLFKSWLSK